VHHLEYGSAVSNRASEAAIGRARQIFAEKHAAYVSGRPLRDERRQVFDRIADTHRKRVLFVEDTVPLRMIGSGFVRSNDIVREMASLGYAITVYPINGCPFDLASVYSDMPDGVEVMHDCSTEQFQAFLALRRGYYDTIWVARTHNLATVRAALEQVSLDPATGEPGSIPPVVLDTEAIASLRACGQADLTGQSFDLDPAIRSELRDGGFCSTIVAINDLEASVLRDLEFPSVAVIGHVRDSRPTLLPFLQRAGMLFVGAIHRMDSPNYDGLCWFIDEVLPLIERELAWETRLTVVGYTGAEVSLDRFREHPRVTLRGSVSDLEPLYDQHRVFVAPTRFAAGMPYKVHEAASFGLPVVATELLRRQLGWSDGSELLAAEATDPAAFARHVVALQRDEGLWHRVRDSALHTLHRDNNRLDYAAAISGVLGPPHSDR
jgi:glycosyltransferase involved in cell wall biosynthesis